MFEISSSTWHLTGLLTLLLYFAIRTRSNQYMKLDSDDIFMTMFIASIIFCLWPAGVILILYHFYQVYTQ